MNRVHTWASAIAAVVCLTTPVLAQQPKESELKSEVPALTAMHDVIAPMWHDAWPKKDMPALAAIASDLQKHAAKVAKAQLPGILRDKAAVWGQGVEKLQATVAAYKAAIDAGDEPGLLKAAETLHADYERLVKIVRPILKEMDEFHAALYVLYHYQTEPLDVPKATATIRAMKPAMDALNAATLPERLASKQEAFGTARTRLAKAYATLLGYVEAGTVDRYHEGILLLHLEYEKLEQVF